MGEAMSCVGAEGDRRQAFDDRFYLAVDLATLEMGAIKLEPIKTMTGKAGEFGIDYAVGKEFDILAACAGADQRIEHEFARRLRLQNSTSHCTSASQVVSEASNPIDDVHPGCSPPSWLRNLLESPGPRFSR